MKISRNMVYYLILNVIVSAVTTLTVLLVWDRPNGGPPFQGENNSPSAMPPFPSSIPGPLSTPTLPSLDQELIKIENIFGTGTLENEVVLLKRIGEGDLDLSGWKLIDSTNHAYTFPHLILNKDGAVQVHTLPGTDTVINLYWGLRSPVWSTGETATLQDPEGNIRSKFTIP